MLRKHRTVGGLMALVLLGGLGCDKAGPKTYPVSGTVELAAGEIKHLAGNHVEAALVGDPTMRASGEIQPDGRFSLETLQSGAIYKGAREGTYKVRIILSDDDKAALRVSRSALSPRYLHFETSGLTIRVPPSADITLPVSRR